jgi:hypothetical protein
MYSALVLDDRSRFRLIEAFKDSIPADFDVVAHHMTITMGPLVGPLNQLKGLEATATVTHFACDDKVCAVKVETEVPSKNKIKHITLGVNRNGGGKPKDSNNLTEWIPVRGNPIELVGLIQEV